MKAKVEIYVYYDDQEFYEEGEVDPSYFYDYLADIVVDIDYELRELATKKEEEIEKAKKCLIGKNTSLEE